VSKAKYLLTLGKLILRVRSRYVPKVVHGCNFNGYAIAKLSFPTKRKVIFEVWDFFSTLAPNSLMARAERFSLSAAEVVVFPSQATFERSAHPRKILLQNSLDDDLVKKLMRAPKSDLELPERFILSGGTHQGSAVSELSSLIAKSDYLNLVVVSNRPPEIPQSPRVFWIGSQDWGDWLNLVSLSSCVWVWYDDGIEHFSRDISPNKYWEACYFNTPMIVNSLAQFVDRVANEPQMLSLGDFRRKPLDSLAKIESFVRSSKRFPRPVEVDDYWKKVSGDRESEFTRLLSILDL
jgi:hypothetical protein